MLHLHTFATSHGRDMSWWAHLWALAGAAAGCYHFWAADYAGGSDDNNGIHQNEGDVRTVFGEEI